MSAAAAAAAAAAAPMDGLSLSDEVCLSQLQQRLQRDVNCLSDPDRSTRRRALAKLQKAFFQESKIPEAVLRGFLSRYLSERLVGMLADPVEKCRELAGGLLLEFVNAVDDVRPATKALAAQVFCMAEARIGSVPLVEPAEEVRALVLRLCSSLLRRKSAETFGCEVAGEACGVLAAALTDPFPEAKRECCSLLLRLAAICPGGLRSRLGKVLRPLMVNLGHQHSKTRQMTLQALGALLRCGSDDLDKTLRELVLPQFRNLLYDRTVAVRRELAGVLTSLVKAGFSPATPAPHAADATKPPLDVTDDSSSAADAPCLVAMDTEDDDHGGGRANGGGGGSAATGKAAAVGGAGSPRRRRIEGGGRERRRRRGYLEPFRAELVSLLMKLLADESGAVRGEAERLFEEVGEVWVQSSGDASPSPSPPTSTTTGAPAAADQKQQQHSPAPPLPPSSAPNAVSAAAARALCVSLLPSMMPMAIEEASHWTVRGRQRALWLLCLLVRYAGEEVTPYLPQLLGSLGEASRDDEAEVRQAVEECAAAVGSANIDLSAVMDVLLPVLRGEISGESNKHLTQALAVLRPLLSASSSARLESLRPHVAPVAAALCGRGLLAADPSVDGELWEAGLEACRALVAAGAAGEGGLRDELRRPRVRVDLLRALLWLLAGSDGGGGGEGGGDTGAKEEVLEVVYQLAAVQAGGGSAQDLLKRHFTELLAYVVGPDGGEAAATTAADAGGAEGADAEGCGWEKRSRRRAGFEALLRSAPAAVGSHLDEVMPIFRGLLRDASREPELRLSMLALLECVVKQEGVTEESLRPHAEILLKEMVLPNAVWRAGLVAATVRKVAIAVLYTALRGSKIGLEAVYASAEQLLPVIKTNLEDHEATTRQMSCLSLEMMFRMMPGALGEEPVRLIYPELLKRLDDSNDTVRMAVCGTIAAFFKATAPQNVRGSVLTYSSEQLLVHLDDQDERMQRAVFAVLEVAASIDPASVSKLAAEARSSHRSPEYCDRLLTLAS
eukprot:g18356.t1